MRALTLSRRHPITMTAVVLAVASSGDPARAQNAQVNGHVAIGGPYTNVYGTDLWVTNNIHVQGAVENDQNGGKERLRVGTAWGWPGLYAETDSLGANSDLILGASTGWVRVGPEGLPMSLRVTGNARVAGDVETANLWLHGQVLNGGSARGGADLFLQANNTNHLFVTFGGGTTNIGTGVFQPGPQKLNVYGNQFVDGSVYVNGGFRTNGHDEFFVNPASDSLIGRTSISRDAVGSCCAPNGDFTLSVAENSQGTGRYPSVQFHAGGQAEGFIRLVAGVLGVPGAPGARTNIPERHFSFGSYQSIMSAEVTGVVYALNVQTEQGFFTKGNPAYFLNPAGFSQLNQVAIQNPINNSSRTLKDNIHHLRPTEVDGLLRDVESMQLARFNYRDRAHGGVERTTHVGFIAEEMPSHLTTDGARGIMMADLTATAIGAIKAQQAQIRAQEAEIAALKARLEKLERGAGRR